MPPARKAAADGAVADGHWKVAKSKMHALLMYKVSSPVGLQRQLVASVLCTCLRWYLRLAARAFRTHRACSSPCAH